MVEKIKTNNGISKIAFLSFIFIAVVDGVRERIEFLKDMEALGMRKKYEPIIHQELGEKIRIIESIDKNKLSEVTEDLEKYKIERPAPKPFPLGDLEDR